MSLPRSVATCWKAGNSARHGPHDRRALQLREPLLEGRDAALEQLGGLRVEAGERLGRTGQLRLRGLQVERLLGRLVVGLGAGLRQPDDEHRRQDHDAQDPGERALHDPYGGTWDGFLRVFCFN